MSAKQPLASTLAACKSVVHSHSVRKVGAAMDDNSAFAYKKDNKSFGAVLISFLFSHVGLFFAAVGYACFGAWVFVKLELPLEQSNYEAKRLQYDSVQESLTLLVDGFWQWRKRVLTNNITADEYNQTMYLKLKDVEGFIISAVNDYGYDGTKDGWYWEWTFSNCILFTMTIMTTIGYGHISPDTFFGQIFCILYSIIGIPLLMIFLANLGEPMGKAFVYVYSRLCCRTCRSQRYQSEVETGGKRGRRKLVVEDEVGKEEYMPTEKVQVPITLILIILALYIMLGGVLFAYWEQWDFASSCYFTFITLSTIGYGDMVPGNSISTSNNDDFGAALTMLISVLYILFGMALLSMSINLMQVQVVQKVHYVAEKLGCVKQNNESDSKDKNSKKDEEKKNLVDNK